MPVSNADVLCSVAAASIMVNAPTGSSGLMKRQVVLFIVIGVIQLGVDWLTFVVLTWSGMAVETANITSRIVGAVFRSPRQRSPQRIRQGARFVAGWTTTTALSTLAVWAIERGFGLHAVWIGKILIDGMLAVMGFVLSKYWIFR
jgi:putative flippase GtrA